MGEKCDFGHREKAAGVRLVICPPFRLPERPKADSPSATGQNAAFSYKSFPLVALEIREKGEIAQNPDFWPLPAHKFYTKIAYFIRSRTGFPKLGGRKRGLFGAHGKDSHSLYIAEKFGRDRII